MAEIISLREQSDKTTKLNVLGLPIEECSCEPMTGWMRDGTCSTDENDHGAHVVCCVMTDEFLEFARDQGNDLITPAPQHGFPGLKAGDHWCVCAATWAQAKMVNKASPVDLKATHMSALEILTLEDLKHHSDSPDHLS